LKIGINVLFIMSSNDMYTLQTKTLSNKASSLVKTILACASLIAIITYGGYSLAVEPDVRAQAQHALTNLQEASIPSSYTSELESIMATMSIADNYQRQEKGEEAEIFYTLVIQKAQVLLQKAVVQPTAATPAIPDVASVPAPAAATPVIPDVASTPEPVTTSSTDKTAKSDVAFVPAPAATSSPATRGLTGAMSVYTVKNGDTLRLIASKLGVSSRHLLSINRLGKKTSVKVGQRLKYDNRRIIPKMIERGIVINIPDRTLYYFKNGALVQTLPVALGTPTKTDDINWQTPTGRFKIIEKIKNPTWTVPPSIQAEMEAQGKEVVTSIPAGPDCPLGKFAIRTSIPGIMIHSTTKPWSINSYSSHGCIRLFPENMESFFKQIAVNTPGEIIYKPVKITVGESGRVFLEVHRDVYDRKINLATEARNLILKKQLSDKVNWRKINDIVKRQDGVIEDITL